MTSDEIMRLEGRELDDALGKSLGIPTPRYLSTAWHGMGHVIEAMAKRGWRLELDTFDDFVFAEAEFYIPGLINSQGRLERDGKYFRATAATAPRAVALAALMVLESHETQDPR